MREKQIVKKLMTGMLTVGILGGSTLLGSVDVQAVKVAPEEMVVSQASSNYYIFSDSDSRYLSADEIYNLSAYEMKLARNEIYARHGRLFKTKKIQAYFDSQDWYYGRVSADDFDEDVFNKYETSNIALIKKCEKGQSSSYTAPNSNYYILPNSDCTYLNGSDLSSLSAYELKLARNEIYARHGRLFKTKKIQAYFDGQAWYRGRISADDFDEDVFNKYETSNIALIKKYEGGSSSAGTTTTSYYILPESSTKYLIYDNIAHLSAYELKLARNEIYARHGRKFKNKKLQSYFNNQAWYNGRISADDFDEDVLSKIEKSNIDFIKSYE